jgi:glycosyltransferase involved in cell wall biosynthesis
VFGSLLDGGRGLSELSVETQSRFNSTAPGQVPGELPATLRTLQIGDRWSLENGGGGADRIFALLASELPQMGIEFQGLVAGPPELGTKTNGLVNGFSPAGAGTVQRWLDARRAVSVLLDSDNPPHLVASHFAMYVWSILDKIRRLPHVVHFHGPWSAESLEEGSGHLSASAKYRLEKAVYQRANRVIVLSNAFAELIHRDYGIQEDRIRVIPGAVACEVFGLSITRAQARLRLGWPTDRPILLALRRLSSRMGLDRLIEAMSAVRTAQPDVLLYIGGQGAQRRALEAQVTSLGLDRHVRFAGFISSELLPFAYRAADINVVPTRTLEGFGLVAAEALASGTPSMVTPVGGLPEVVSPLSHSLVFQSSAAPDIADGLIQALSGRISLPSEAACRRYAAENFPASLMAARTALVYREATSGQ